MLFTTATFVLLFLPVVRAGCMFLGGGRPDWAAASLLVAALILSGWWMPQFTALLLLSSAVNFTRGVRIARVVSKLTVPVGPLDAHMHGSAVRNAIPEAAGAILRRTEP
jgi:hypothetical protein